MLLHIVYIPTADGWERGGKKMEVVIDVKHPPPSCINALALYLN